MKSILAVALTIISTHASADFAKFNNLNIGCEGKEDGQIIKLFQGHVIRFEDGGAEAEYYRVTEINKTAITGELVFTGLRTNDPTGVTASYKGPMKTIELQRVKEKSWKVATKQVVASSKKNDPYVHTHNCKEE